MKVQKILTEAFSPSMPIWLKNYLLYNTERRVKDHKTAPLWRSTRMYSEPKGAEDEYSNFRRATSRDTGRDDKSLIAINILNQLGINLEKANFNEISPPPKLNSPLFSDSDKLCISWLHSNFDNTVWITGRSAPHEKFTLNDGKTIALQNINNKQYQSVCKGFCWLDMTDPNNFREQDQQKRAASRSGSVERDRQQGKAAERSIMRGMGSYSSYDKSGYYKIPAVKKYADELARRKQSGLANEVVKTREALVKLKDDIKTVMDSLMDNPYSYSVKNGVKDATTDFANAMETFERVTYYANQLSKNSNLSNIVRMLQNFIYDTNKYINSAYKEIGQFVPTSIDYDVDDVTIYDDTDWSEFT